ncbi:MAG: Lrp/AsnC family transcriptional regulator, partial [Bacteroidia bacterium]
MPIDAVDRKILKLLQKDAKLTTKELATQLHLTTTPVFERVKRLERDGLIRNYVALLDRKKIGLHLLAYCSVNLKEHSRPYLLEFEQKVLELDAVVEVSHIAGGFDYLLKVIVKDMTSYQLFISEQLATLDNIGRVESFMVMKEI